MSDSVRPQGGQPTRLLRPWDSPGKNTGVGCHFLLQYMKVKSESEVAQSCPTPSDSMDCSLPGSSVHGIFQARGGCHCLLRNICLGLQKTVETVNRAKIPKRKKSRGGTQHLMLFSIKRVADYEIEGMRGSANLLGWKKPIKEES